MRRLIALVLAQALVASLAMLPSLHVHEYGEHDHPNHHHGPASHHHEAKPVLDHGHSHASESHHDSFPEERTSLSPACGDPGRHTLLVTVGCVHVRSFHIDRAELAGPTLAAPSTAFRYIGAPTDVRVHGPPPTARIPSRAPPVT